MTPTWPGCPHCQAELSRLSVIVTMARAEGRRSRPGRAAGGHLGRDRARTRARADRRFGAWCRRDRAAPKAAAAGPVPQPHEAQPPRRPRRSTPVRSGRRFSWPQRLVLAAVAGLLIGAGVATGIRQLAQPGGPAVVGTTALRPLPQFPHGRRRRPRGHAADRFRNRAEHHLAGTGQARLLRGVAAWPGRGQDDLARRPEQAPAPACSRCRREPTCASTRESTFRCSRSTAARCTRPAVSCAAPCPDERCPVEPRPVEPRPVEPCLVEPRPARLAATPARRHPGPPPPRAGQMRARVHPVPGSGRRQAVAAHRRGPKGDRRCEA